MSRALAAVTLLALSCVPTFAAERPESTDTKVAPVRTLTFEDRVAAQRAIEQANWNHRSWPVENAGDKPPLAQVLSEAAIQGKVEEYLRQSAALERYWNTPITAQMLERELERMTRQTRMPERLQEIFASVGNDSFILQECLARAALADRLSRNLFAHDTRIHADARARADALRQELLAGEIDPAARRMDRDELQLKRKEAHAGRLPDGSDREALGVDGDPFQLDLTPAEFQMRRSELLDHVGGVSGVVERRDAFVIRVLLSEDAQGAQAASFVVRKRTWDEWWPRVSATIDGSSVRPVVADVAIVRHDPARTRGALESSAPACLPDDTWDNASLGAPLERYDHTAVWTGSEMIVWGGYDGSNYLSSGGRYDPATDTWTSTSMVGAPAPRSLHTAVWTGSVMVVWGGNAATFLDTGGRYDPTTDTWMPTAMAGAPRARIQHTAIWTGSVMVVWGGKVSDFPAVNTGGRYDPASDTWTATAVTGAATIRYGHTAVWTGNLMIVWGGTAAGTAIRGGRYDPVMNTWSPVLMSIVNAPTARTAHSAVWTGSVMVVWGGVDGTDDTATGGRYNPVSNTWAPTATNYPAAWSRGGHSAVWTGSLMVVWGGFHPQADNFEDTGGRYDPVTDTWQAQTTQQGGPEPRSRHTAIWTGTSMVVWGGATAGRQFNVPAPTGGRYNPASDTWTPTALSGGGTGPRRLHSATWTGTEMVVWGGWNEGGILNTGDRYDPATDTWTPTSTIGAPSARIPHAVVWTGTKVLVWGGQDASGLVNTGARYNPATNTWEPTGTIGAPTPRNGNTAVWSGRELLVWGGQDASGFVNTGARYNPATDAWKPTSTSGTPSARSGPAAVWTGAKMVVWGGYVAGSCINTGGRYDPTTDTWSPTSTTNAPVACGATAVWTGTRMVVWGGFDSVNVLGTGGRYDPESDVWAATSTTGAPSARQLHSAVWSGREMIVWGGDTFVPYPALPYTNTGGRYDPVTDTWAPTTTIGAPTARSGHTAVWTGSMMLVWGGDGYTTYAFGSGGRYVVGRSVDDDGDGWSECAGDCDDTNPAVYPGAPEICDGVNNNCSDPSWPTLPPGDVDGDSDGVRVCQNDCNDANSLVWRTPGEIRNVLMSHDRSTGISTLSWIPPADPGGSVLVYDTIRTETASDFMTATCIETNDGTDLVAQDTASPVESHVFFYLVRAKNTCPVGGGSLGADSHGVLRTGRFCP